MMYHRKKESNERTASVNEISISIRKQQNVAWHEKCSKVKVPVQTSFSTAIGFI